MPLYLTWPIFWLYYIPWYLNRLFGYIHLYLHRLYFGYFGYFGFMASSLPICYYIPLLRSFSFFITFYLD